ncbi:hypothetical protein [Streptomyces sp. NPDC053431]
MRRRGGFGLVVGLDRARDGQGTAALLPQGADPVAADRVAPACGAWGERG